MRNYPEPSNYSEWQDFAAVLIDIVRLIDQQVTNFGDVGEVQEFVQLPASGWLEANGGTFEQATYPALAQILGGTTLPTYTPQYDAGNVVGIRAR